MDVFLGLSTSVGMGHVATLSRGLALGRSTSHVMQVTVWQDMDVCNVMDITDSEHPFQHVKVNCGPKRNRNL